MTRTLQTITSDAGASSMEGQKPKTMIQQNPDEGLSDSLPAWRNIPTATKESLIQFLTEHLIKASMREKQMALCSNLVEVFQHSHIHVSVKEILDHEIPFIQIDITMTFPSAAIPSNRDPPICASFCINSKIHVTEVINANILTCKSHVLSPSRRCR